MHTGNGSFWLASTPDPRSPRPSLNGDETSSVAIVGAGYTGLWAAYWIKKQNPALSVLVIDKNKVGYGASGRNGGWISGKTVGLRKNLGKYGSAEDVLFMERACHQAVGDIADFIEKEDIDSGLRRGGWMQIARTESEMARLAHHAEADYAAGLTQDDVRLLDARETVNKVNAPGLVGSLFSPYSARINPARLAFGLARICEDMGVKIYEDTAAEIVSRNSVNTSRGVITAETVVLATEGFTCRFPERRRDILPMLSSMVVTRPLAESEWEKIGWDDYVCMSGADHVYFYSQRTEDGRIAIGGRGKPYRWGSAMDDDGRLNVRTQTQLMEILGNLFPAVSFEFEHAWCGVLGVTRDWSPFISRDNSSGVIEAGGYAGQGVTAAYVAGKTIADLVSGADTELTRSVWVRDRPRKWEPEPLRWIGSHAVQKLYQTADVIERRRGGPKTSVVAAFANRVSGRV